MLDLIGFDLKKIQSEVKFLFLVLSNLLTIWYEIHAETDIIASALAHLWIWKLSSTGRMLWDTIFCF